jgi:hypothetical protein
MRRKVIGGVLTLIGLALAVGCVGGSDSPGATVEITRADLDAALAAALARGREVDFPQRIRFEALRFRHAAGLGIEGRARFHDPATGGYPPPDIAFFGSVPMVWWQVEDGALVAPLAIVDGIEPVPGGAAPTSPAADRISDSLGSAIGEVLSRMTFPSGLDPNRRWTIGSRQSTPEALRFELRPR